jgi:hypothetical protein
LDLQRSVQSVPITTNVMSSNAVLKFVSYLRHVGVFSGLELIAQTVVNPTTIRSRSRLSHPPQRIKIKIRLA